MAEKNLSNTFIVIGKKKVLLKDWLSSQLEEIKKIVGPKFTVSSIEKINPQKARIIDQRIEDLDAQIKLIMSVKNERARIARIRTQQLFVKMERLKQAYQEAREEIDKLLR